MGDAKVFTNLDTSGKGAGSTGVVTLPEVRVEKEPSQVEAQQPETTKATTSKPADAQELKKITSEVKSLGVDLSDLLDKNGDIPPDKLFAARTRLIEAAEKRAGTDIGASARLYQKAGRLGGGLSRKLEMATAGALKKWADSQKDPAVKNTLYLEALTHLCKLNIGPNVGLHKDPDYSGLRAQLHRQIAEDYLGEGNAGMAREHLRHALAHGDGEQSAEFFSFVQSHPELLEKGSSAYQFVGRALVDAGRFDMAQVIYQSGAKNSQDPADKEFCLKATHFVDETLHGYETDFDASTQPAVFKIYQALREKSFPNAQIKGDFHADQFPKERKVSAAEVLGFVQKNLDDPNVKAALKEAGISIPKKLYAQIKEKGLAVTMAEYHDAEAKKLIEKDRYGNSKEIVIHLQAASDWEPSSAKRSYTLGEFALKHGQPKVAAAALEKAAPWAGMMQPQLLPMLAKAYLQDGQPKKALDTLAKFQENAGLNVTESLRSDAYKTQAEATRAYLPEALKNFDKAVALGVKGPIEAAQKDLESLSPDLPEGKFQIYSRLRRLYQSQLEDPQSEPLTQEDAKIRLKTVDEKIGFLRDSLHQGLEVKKGESPTQDQLGYAHTLIQIDKELGDRGALKEDLKTFKTLLDTVSSNDTDPKVVTAGYCEVFRELHGLRYPPHEIGTTTGGDLPLPQSDPEIMHLLEDIANRVSQPARLVVKGKNDIDLMEDLFMGIAQDKEGFGAAHLDFLSPEGLQKYVDSVNAGETAMTAAAKATDPKEKRGHLLTAIKSYGLVLDDAKVDEAVAQMEATLPEDMPKAQRLMVYGLMAGALKEQGSKIAAYEKITKTGDGLAQELLDQPASGIEGAQGLFAAKTYFESMGDLEKVAQAQVKLRAQSDQLVNFLKFGDKANGIAKPTDPKERLALIRMAVQIDQELMGSEVAAAGKVLQEIAEGKRPASDKPQFLHITSRLALWRKELEGAKDLPLQDRIQEGSAMARALGQFNTLTQGKDPLLDPKSLHLESVFLEKTMGAVLSEFYQGTPQAALADEKISHRIQKDLQAKLHEDIQKGNGTWLASITEPNLGKFVELSFYGHQLLDAGEKKSGGEKIDLAFKAATLFAQIGLKDRVKESLQSTEDQLLLVKDEGTRAQLYLNQSQIFQMAGLSEEANDSLQRVATMDSPGKPEEIRNLGKVARAMIHLNKGEIDDAKKKLAEIPDHPMAKKILEGLVQGERELRLNQSLQLMRSWVLMNNEGSPEHQALVEKGLNTAMLQMKQYVMEGECATLEQAFTRVVSESPPLIASRLQSCMAGGNDALGSIQGQDVGTRVSQGIFKLSQPNLSQDEASEEIYNLAMFFVNGGRYQVAGQLAAMITDDPTMGAKAKTLVEDKIPEHARATAIWTGAKGLSALTPPGAFLSIFLAGSDKEAKEATINALMMVGSFGLARAAAVGAEALWVARMAPLIESPIIMSATKFGVRTVTEAAAFPVAGALMQTALTGKTEHWDVHHLSREFGTMLVTFVLLHGAGMPLQRMQQATGKTVQEAETALNTAIKAKSGVAEAQTALARAKAVDRAAAAVSWGGRVAAFTGSEYVNEAIGLKEKENVGFWYRFIGSAITDAQMIAGGKLVDGITGGKITKLEQANHKILMMHSELPTLAKSHGVKLDHGKMMKAVVERARKDPAKFEPAQIFQDINQSLYPLLGHLKTLPESQRQQVVDALFAEALGGRMNGTKAKALDKKIREGSAKLEADPSGEGFLVKEPLKGKQETSEAKTQRRKAAADKKLKPLIEDPSTLKSGDKAKKAAQEDVEPKQEPVAEAARKAHGPLKPGEGKPAETVLEGAEARRAQARETIEKLGKNLAGEFGLKKVPESVQRAVEEAAANDPEFKPETTEGKLRETLKGYEALKKTLAEVPFQKRKSVEREVLRQLAEGKIDVATIKKATGEGMTKDRISELEMQLGRPRLAWVSELLAQDGVALAKRMEEIETTRDQTGKLVQNILDGGDRKSIKAQMVAVLQTRGYQLGGDNAKAVDSMVDVILTAKAAGVVDHPNGLSRDQLVSLLSTLYLNNSPTIRMAGAELTHVPMVVQGVIDHLVSLNPQATVAERRVAFVTALLHDAAKFDPNIRTESGYTLGQHPFFNPTGKDVVVQKGETFTEALDRMVKEGQMTEAERAQVKMPGFLISVITHHDGSNVRQSLVKLESMGILKKGEADKSWQAIERHGLVSSWILDNSFGGLSVLSHVFTRPEFKAFVEKYRELYSEMLQGKSLEALEKERPDDVAALRKIFSEKFSALDRAMLLGDHQGQRDPFKYSGILANSPANKGASIHQVLLGGDPVNSVDGVIRTHSNEQRLLSPQTGNKSARAFEAAGKWLANLDPNSPGLGQALMKDAKTKAAFEKWKAENPTQEGTLENWLKSEKVHGPDGKPGEIYQAIQAAMEKAYYQHYALEAKTKGEYEWAPKPADEPVEDVTDHAKMEPPPLPPKKPRAEATKTPPETGQPKQTERPIPPLLTFKSPSMLEPPPFFGELRPGDYRADIESFSNLTALQPTLGPNGEMKFRIVRLRKGQQAHGTWFNGDLHFTEISYRESMFEADLNTMRTYLWWGRKIIEHNAGSVRTLSKAATENLNGQFKSGTSVHAVERDGKIRFEKVYLDAEGKEVTEPAEIATFQAFLDYVGVEARNHQDVLTAKQTSKTAEPVDVTEFAEQVDIMEFAPLVTDAHRLGSKGDTPENRQLLREKAKKFVDRVSEHASPELAENVMRFLETVYKSGVDGNIPAERVPAFAEDASRLIRYTVEAGTEGKAELDQVLSTTHGVMVKHGIAVETPVGREFLGVVATTFSVGRSERLESLHQEAIHHGLPSYAMEPQSSKYTVTDAFGRAWNTVEEANAWSQLTEGSSGSAKPLAWNAYRDAYEQANGGKGPPAEFRAHFEKILAGKFLDSQGTLHETVQQRNFSDDVNYLAATETPFAAAALELQSGKITEAQYHERQGAVAKKLLQDYRPAYEQVMGRLDELSKDGTLGVKIHIEGRMKAHEDIAAKIKRRDWKSLAPMTDIAGTRVIIETGPGVKPVAASEAIIEALNKKFAVRDEYDADGTVKYEVVGIIEEGGEQVHEIKFKTDMDGTDRLTEGHPASGYRARHLVAEVQVTRPDGSVELLPVEIQIKTDAFHDWGEIQHRLVYKSETGSRLLTEGLKDYCRNVSDYLAVVTNAKEGPLPPRPEFSEHLREMIQELPELSRLNMEKDLQAMENLMEVYEAKVRVPEAEAARAEAPVEKSEETEIKSGIFPTERPPSTADNVLISEGDLNKFLKFTDEGKTGEGIRDSLQKWFETHPKANTSEGQAELMELLTSGKRVFIIDFHGQARLETPAEIQSRASQVFQRIKDSPNADVRNMPETAKKYLASQAIKIWRPKDPGPQASPEAKARYQRDIEGYQNSLTRLLDDYAYGMNLAREFGIKDLGATVVKNAEDWIPSSRKMTGPEFGERWARDLALMERLFPLYEELPVARRKEMLQPWGDKIKGGKDPKLGRSASEVVVNQIFGKFLSDLPKEQSRSLRDQLTGLVAENNIPTGQVMKLSTALEALDPDIRAGLLDTLAREVAKKSKSGTNVVVDPLQEKELKQFTNSLFDITTSLAAEMAELPSGARKILLQDLQEGKFTLPVALWHVEGLRARDLSDRGGATVRPGKPESATVPPGKSDGETIKPGARDERATLPPTVPPGAAGPLAIGLGLLSLLAPSVAKAAPMAEVGRSQAEGLLDMAATHGPAVAVAAGMGIILGIPFFRYFRSRASSEPLPPQPATAQDPVKIQAWGNDLEVYPFEGGDKLDKKAMMSRYAQVDLDASLVSGDLVMVVFTTHRFRHEGGEYKIEEGVFADAVSMSKTDAMRLGLEFGPDGDLVRTTPLKKGFMLSAKSFPSEEIPKSIQGTAAEVPESKLPSMEAQGERGQTVKVRTLELDEDLGALDATTTTLGEVVEVKQDPADSSRVQVGIRVYSPLDPDASPTHLHFKISATKPPKVLETRVVSLSRAEAAERGLIGPRTVVEGKILVLEDPPAAATQEHPVTIMTGPGKGFSLFPTHNLGKNKVLMGRMLRVVPEESTWLGDQVTLMFRVPDMPGSKGVRIGHRTMSIEQARALGVRIAPNGEVIGPKNNEFLGFEVTRSSEGKIEVDGKPVGESMVVSMEPGPDGEMEMRVEMLPREMDPKFAGPMRKYKFAKALVDLADSGLADIPAEHVQAAKAYAAYFETPAGQRARKIPPHQEFMKSLGDYSYRIVPASGKSQMGRGELTSLYSIYPDGKIPPGDKHRHYRVKSTGENGEILLINGEGETLAVRGLGKQAMAHPFQKGDPVVYLPEMAGGSGTPQNKLLKGNLEGSEVIVEDGMKGRFYPDSLTAEIQETQWDPQDPRVVVLHLATRSMSDPLSQPKMRILRLWAHEAKNLGIELDAQGHLRKAPSLLISSSGGKPVTELPKTAAAPIQPPPTKPEDLLPTLEGILPDGTFGFIQDNAPGKPRRGEHHQVSIDGEYGSVSFRTHEGRDYKDRNEDGVVQGKNWALVLDGMGGHGSGDMASQIAGEAIARFMKSPEARGEPAEVMVQALKVGNAAINKSPYKSAGAVAAMHWVVTKPNGDKVMLVAHVGDAGILVVGADGKPRYRSKDQSWPEEVRKAEGNQGKSPEEAELKARIHPMANVVLGGLGAGSETKPVVAEIPLEPGIKVLMFSDGVGDNVSTTDLARMAHEGKTAESIQNKIFETVLTKMSDLEDVSAEIPASNATVIRRTEVVGGMLLEDPVILSEGKRLNITLPDGTMAYMERVHTVNQEGKRRSVSFNIYDSPQGGKLIDHYKPDNLTLHVFTYEGPQGPGAGGGGRGHLRLVPKPTPPSQVGAPKMQELSRNQGVGKDLSTYEVQKTSFFDTHPVPGITRERALELEAAFEEGGYVMDWSTKGYPTMGIQFVRLESGAHTMAADYATPAEFAFYRAWEAERGYGKKPDPQLAKQAWGELQARAKKLGIPIKIGSLGRRARQEINFTQLGAQIVLVNEVLQLLPDSMLKNMKLKAINLDTARVGAGKLSSFERNEVNLFSGTFSGSRRHLVGMLLHELGHSTAERYFPGAEGDPSIPEPVRQKMVWAHGVLAKHNALIGLDHAGGPQYRKGYQNSFTEFLAEMNLIYVATGPKLRDHIAQYPEGSEVRTAWEFVYHEMQNRIFSGVEFGYQKKAVTTTAVEVPTPPDASVQTNSMGLVDKSGNLFFRMPADKQEIILGRGQFGGDDAISTHHLRVYRQSGGIFIQDLGSLNGTRVIRKGKEVYAYRTPNGDRRRGYTVALRPGDKVEIGQTSFYVY